MATVNNKPNYTNNNLHRSYKSGLSRPIVKSIINSTDVRIETVLSSDTENNNNILNPKCKIISNCKIPHKNKESPLNVPSHEDVADKIEVTEHALKLGNVHTAKGICRDYNDILENEVLLNNEQLDISRKSAREKRPVAHLNLDGNFVRKKKRPYVDRCKPRNGFVELEKNERLVIRLVRLDISDNLNESTANTSGSLASVPSCDLEESQNKSIQLLLPKLGSPTKKVSKTDLHRKNLLNINKTESLKMEQLLLEKFKKSKERQAIGESSKEASENSTNEVEPYVYEKTDKSVYETYELAEDESGQIMLRCLLCPFSSETFKQMSLHYKFKHRNTPIEEMHFCNVRGCNFKAVHKGMFTWHMRRHMLAADKLISDLHPCHQCNKVFDQRKGYLIHMKHMHKDFVSTPEENTFPCATCKFTTNTRQNLQAHIYRSHIPDNIKPTYTCNVCGYETNYKSCFKKHLTRVHLQN